MISISSLLYYVVLIPPWYRQVPPDYSLGYGAHQLITLTLYTTVQCTSVKLVFVHCALIWADILHITNTIVTGFRFLLLLLLFCALSLSHKSADWHDTVHLYTPQYICTVPVYHVCTLCSGLGRYAAHLVQ